MKNIIILILIISTGVSCTERNIVFTETQKQQVAFEVRQTLDSYTNDIHTKGLLSEFMYLDSSADFFWVPPGYTMALSYDSVSNIINRTAPTLKLVDNNWNTLRIIPLSAVLANYTGVIQSKMILKNDSVLLYRMIETGVVIKRNNGWKLLSGQTSILPPVQDVR